MSWKWFIEKAFIPILAALIAAYASLVAANVLPNPFTPTFTLKGVWESENQEGILFRITFKSKCNVGDICGKVELPTIGCIAFPELVSTDGETFIFKETNHQNCGPVTGNDIFKLASDDVRWRGEIITHRKKEGGR